MNAGGDGRSQPVDSSQQVLALIYTRNFGSASCILSLLENEVMTLGLERPRLSCRLSETLGWMFGLMLVQSLPMEWG